jgi:hypothetical protein
MTDQDEPDTQPRDADELTRQVAELGDTTEDRLDAVAEHNDSLEQRLPDDDELPRTKGPSTEDSSTEQSGTAGSATAGD